MPLLLQPKFRNVPSLVVYIIFQAQYLLFKVWIVESVEWVVFELQYRGIVFPFPTGPKDFSLKNLFSWEGCFVNG